MPAGRPSLYDPAYCEEVVALGRLGKSEAQISAAIDVPRSTLHNWRDAHQEFAAALTRARDLAQAWWEDAAQNGNANSVIGPAVWKHSMNCRFRGDYAERQEHSGPDGGAIKTEDAAASLMLKAFLDSRSTQSG